MSGEKYDPQPLLKNARDGLRTAGFSVAWLLGTDEADVCNPDDVPDLTEHQLRVLTALHTRIAELRVSLEQIIPQAKD